MCIELYRFTRSCGSPPSGRVSFPGNITQDSLVIISALYRYGSRAHTAVFRNRSHFFPLSLSLSVSVSVSRTSTDNRMVPRSPGSAIFSRLQSGRLIYAAARQTRKVIKPPQVRSPKVAGPRRAPKAEDNCVLSPFATAVFH